MEGNYLKSGAGGHSFSSELSFIYGIVEITSETFNLTWGQRRGWKPTNFTNLLKILNSVVVIN